MLDTLTKKFSSVFEKIGSRGILTEAHIDEGMRDIRVALLEADVNYDVIKSFIKRVKERAVGENVIKNVKPAQMLVKIVHDELIDLMGPVEDKIPFKSSGITIIMMAGLQGSGKTTTCGKLAFRLRKKHGKKPLLVAADVQRPAAIEQLKVLGKQIDIPVYFEDSKNAIQICQNSIEHAKKLDRDVIILDTAGRLHIDDALMGELIKISSNVKPDQIYLVCDSMTGQDAVVSASAFNAKLSLDGVILTKLDGDARGGAALSVKAVTQKPIKFIGIGEKIDDLEEFHPDRMAGRILGMGDIVSLVEKAQEHFDEEQQTEALRKMVRNEFTLMDFLEQMKQMERLGPLKNIMKMIPQLGNSIDDDMMNEGEKHLKKIKTIINSMTPAERVNPEMINTSRKGRIAKGSAVEVKDVNDLLREFQQMRKMMKEMFSGGMNIPGMPKIPGLGKMMAAKGFSSGKKVTEDKLAAYRKVDPKKKKKKKK